VFPFEEWGLGEICRTGYKEQVELDVVAVLGTGQAKETADLPPAEDKYSENRASRERRNANKNGGGEQGVP